MKHIGLVRNSKTFSNDRPRRFETVCCESTHSIGCFPDDCCFIAGDMAPCLVKAAVEPTSKTRKRSRRTIVSLSIILFQRQIDNHGERSFLKIGLGIL